ncbi:MAG TPA: type II secretion system F family protein [Acidimicrobiales bacterium]|nr:type II secretion system F family protein [Acidimicrobiales bacterium]
MSALSNPGLIASMFLVVGVALAWAITTHLNERSVRRAALARLGGYEHTDERQAELALGWKDRLFFPLFDGLASSGHRFTPVGYKEKMARKLRAAGKGSDLELERFLAVRVLTVAAIVPVVLIFFSAFGRGKSGLAMVGLAVMLLSLGPGIVLNRKVVERQVAISRALPDVLDLLVISIEAGLGFEQALDRTVSSVPGPLTEEFSRVLGEVRAGANRGDAMRAFAERVDVEEVRGFVLAVLQADTFGVSIGRMLRGQAEELRVRRRQQAQEKAMKAPVKMLIPMVFCIFPAIFVVIIGPAILNIVHTLPK